MNTNEIERIEVNGQEIVISWIGNKENPNQFKVEAFFNNNRVHLKFASSLEKAKLEKIKYLKRHEINDTDSPEDRLVFLLIKDYDLLGLNS